MAARQATSPALAPGAKLQLRCGGLWGGAARNPNQILNGLQARYRQSKQTSVHAQHAGWLAGPWAGPGRTTDRSSLPHPWPSGGQPRRNAFCPGPFRKSSSPPAMNFGIPPVALPQPGAAPQPAEVGSDVAARAGKSGRVPMRGAAWPVRAGRSWWPESAPPPPASPPPPPATFHRRNLPSVAGGVAGISDDEMGVNVSNTSRWNLGKWHAGRRGHSLREGASAGQ